MTAFGIRSLVLSLTLLSAPVVFAQTLVTFEDFPPGTELTHQYGTKGVHFRGATTFISSLAHSGRMALYSVAPNIEAFTWPGPLVIDFDTDQSAVQLYSGTDYTQPVVATLTAFNAAGVAIAHDGPRTLPPQELNSLMKVSVAQPAIRRVETSLRQRWQRSDGRPSVYRLARRQPAPQSAEGHHLVANPLPEDRWRHIHGARQSRGTQP